MASWTKLESKLARPKDFVYDKIDKPEFCEQHSTVFARNRLFFFGRLGASASSDNYHETTLLGGFVSAYDLNDKKWSFTKIDKIDDDEHHRDHVFTVGDSIFMYVYSTTDQTYQTLYQWENDKWHEIQMGVKLEADKNAPCGHHKFLATKSGFYVLYEQSGEGHVAKLHVTLNGGRFKSADLNHVTKTGLVELGHGAHFTCAAYSDKKMIVWYGQQRCGFHWEPAHPLKVDFGKTPKSFEHLELTEPARPPYAFGGPTRTVADDRNRLIMLGGSLAKGMSQTKPCDEIWTFDVEKEKFGKSSVEMPKFDRKWSATVAHDFSTGNVYVCELESGIFVINTKSI